MSQPPSTVRSGRLEALAWVLATLAVQGAMLAAPGFLERDAEELFTAGQAWLALHGDLPWLLHMQYRPYCGGCTVHAVTAMGLFSVLPPTWLTWKLIPLLWGAGGMGIGFLLARREAGPASSRMFALLWLFPPLTFSHLSLVAWGNHFEAGIMSLLVASLMLGPRGFMRRFGLGVVLGLSVYLSFSAGFLVLGCLGILAHRERLRGVLSVLAGIPVGLLGWVAQWYVAGRHPFHTIYEAKESVPDPLRLPSELWTLLAPRQLAALFGIPLEGVGMWLGVSAALMVAAAAALSVRSGPGLGRLAAVLLGVFLAVYGLTGFSVKVAESGFMYAGGLRYAAPLYPLSFLVLATVAGLLWSRGRRLAALVMIAPLLASGLWARVHVLSDAQPLPGRLERDAVDWDYLRERLAWMIPQEGHEAGLQSSDPHTRAVHAYGLAREATTAAVRGGNQAEVPSGCPAGHGVGDALAPDSAAILSGGRSLADLILLGAEADRDCVFERLAVEAIAGGRAEAWVGGALPVDAEAGLGHAAGSAWAARTAGPAPRTVVLPSGVSGPFIAGVGLGLGRRWGPVAAAHPPDGLADEAVGEFLAGVARGVARDWSLGRGSPDP